MKSLESSRQVKYNKTTSLLVAVHTWRILGIFFLWGVSLGILHPAFGIPAGVGDILIGVTAIPFAYFLWKGFSWSKYAVVVWSVLGIAESSQCSQPWFNHCFGIWRINNDVFPVGSSTYCLCILLHLRCMELHFTVLRNTCIQ